MRSFKKRLGLFGTCVMEDQKWIKLHSLKIMKSLRHGGAVCHKSGLFFFVCFLHESWCRRCFYRHSHLTTRGRGSLLLLLFQFVVNAVFELKRSIIAARKALAFRRFALAEHAAVKV